MKKNSWHYACAKLANENRSIYDGELSICQYVRKVIWGAGVFSMIIVALLAVIALFCVGAYEIAGTIFGFAAMSIPAFITIAVVTLLLFGVAHAVFVDYTQHTRRNLMRKDNSTFIAKAYRSYKEKVCYPIEFEDDK